MVHPHLCVYRQLPGRYDSEPNGAAILLGRSSLLSQVSPLKSQASLSCPFCSKKIEQTIITFHNGIVFESKTSVL